MTENLAAMCLRRATEGINRSKWYRNMVQVTLASVPRRPIYLLGATLLALIYGEYVASRMVLTECSEEMDNPNIIVREANALEPFALNQSELNLAEIATLIESHPFVVSELLSGSVERHDELNTSGMLSNRTNRNERQQRSIDYFATTRFRKNRILVQSNVTSAYTSHDCIGGDTGYELQADGSLQIAIDRYFRRCTFRNLGLSTNGTLVYHVNPTDVESNEFYGFYKKRTSELDKHYSIGLKFVTNPIESVDYPNHTNGSVAKHCIIFAHDGDYGHMAGHDFDSIWNAFNSMVSMRMLSLENEIVLKRKKSRANQHIQDVLRLAELQGRGGVRKFWSTIARAVSYHDKFTENYAGSVLSCVLLANSHKTMMTFPTFQNGLIPRLYRDRALILQNVTLPSPRTQPRIAVRFKDRGHAFVNHNDMVGHLKTRYPGAVVTDYRANQTTPLLDELRTIASQDIYITPAGGGSYGGVFVRDGRTIIYGNVCWAGTTRRAGSNPIIYGQQYRNKNGTELYCMRQDNFVWSLMPHYHKRYLNAAKASDIVSAVYDKPYEKRVHAHLLANSYHVNLGLLESFVDEALINMGFGNYSVSKRGFKS